MKIYRFIVYLYISPNLPADRKITGRKNTGRRLTDAFRHFFFSQAQKCIPVCDYFEPLYGQAPTSNHFWRPDPVSLILRD